ncbi:ABC transporter permease [Tundrisphaera lichenicola]|uniref:ABC transporter permease n=1 Tax=Tundrisphaera lichenicola TaxID=2029860 RepID=UPI003EBB418C
MKDVRTRPSIPHTEYFPNPAPLNGPARWWGVLRGDARELIRFWPVIQNMVTQDLRIRYHRSVLGFFWTLLNPILMMATLTMVFSQVFGQLDWKEFAIYLFAGQVSWSLFAGSLTDCSNCIVANEGLIRKIYVPKLIFPISKVLINLTTFVLSLVALYFLVALFGAKFTPAMTLLPLVTLLFAVFALGLGLVLAVANTFFRDTGHLVVVVLQAWYFATPIIWGHPGIEGRGALSPAMEARCWLNPAYPFIRMFQVIIRDGQWPSLTMFLVAAGIASVSLGIGYVTFKSHENKLVFRL